jgi:hypothetical protein
MEDVHTHVIQQFKRIHPKKQKIVGSNPARVLKF